MSLRLIDLNRLNVLPTWEAFGERHRHQHHELIYCCSPGYRVQVGDELLHPGPGTACYYPPGLVHTPAPVDRCTYLLVQWQEGPADQRAAWPDRRRLLPDTECRLLNLLDWLLDEWMAAAPRTTPQAELLLRCLIGALPESEDQVGPGRLSPPIRRMLRTIRDRFFDRLQLDDLADVAGQSRWQLVRSCKAETGETPMRLLRRTRLRAARNLLLDGRETGEVLRAVGYGNGRALDRALHEEYGRGIADLRREPLAHENEAVRPEETWWAAGLINRQR